MGQALSRLFVRSAILVCVAVSAAAACTHTTDRVIEPAGNGDASTPTPEVAEAGVNPIGPIAHPNEPAEDFRLVRGPELGAALELTNHYDTFGESIPVGSKQQSASGSAGSGGTSGVGGGNSRPVAAGGGRMD